MMTAQIFYGAGQYTRRNIAMWLDKGYKPVCFVDADENKWYKKFKVTEITEFEILPLDKAIASFPDYELYLAQPNDNLLSVKNSLIQKGISEMHIKMFDDLELRKGCSEMDHMFFVDSAFFAPCCNHRFRDSGKMIKYGDYNNFQADYDCYLSSIEDLIVKMKNGEMNICSNCPKYVTGYFKKHYAPNLIYLGGAFDGETCNCSCMYCHHGNGENLPLKGQHTLFGIVKQLSSVLPNDMQFGYGGTEITVGPDREKIYEILAYKNWKLDYILTSGIKYEPMLINLSRPGTIVNCSLDSGTQETYKKVKRVDCFERVKNNLLKYKCDGFWLFLKYVVLNEINDNAEDMDNFIEFARQHTDSIGITVNSITRFTGMCEKLWEAIEYIVKNARKVGLSVQSDANCFNNAEWARMNEIIAK